MKKWIVTCVDYGESCDGKARVLQVCDTKEEAEAYIRNDMEDFMDKHPDEGFLADFNKWSIGFDWETADRGCEWNAEEVEI